MIGVLNEVSLKYKYEKYNFKIIEDLIEKVIYEEEKHFLGLIKKGKTPRYLVYVAIANLTGDLLESGRYHIYRGVLNPII